MGDEKPGSALKRTRVREYLRDQVESLVPGDPIPSERTLCEQLGVSRPTLRAAVDELVTTGLIVREHGRGMFVAPAKITQELAPAPEERGFSLPPASGTWSSQVLELSNVQAGARVGRKLHISPAAMITYIARLRLVDGEPMAIEHLHIPADLVPALASRDMETGDFYELLRERHGVRVHEAVQSMEPTVTSEKEARLLSVPVLSPALLIERLTSDDTGRPVEYVHSIYRGDRYRMVSRISLGESGAGRGGRAGGEPAGIPLAPANGWTTAGGDGLPGQQGMTVQALRM